MKATNIVGVILAGGLSTRMGGGDKPFLPLAGRPVLAHVIERLRPQADRLVINANGDPARFAAFGLPVIPDTVPGHPGPLGGILAGLVTTLFVVPYLFALLRKRNDGKPARGVFAEDPQ